MALATRCPHCDTVFRLDPHLLAPHDGRVRCGHCQEIFDAAHYQFDRDAIAVTARAAATPVHAPAPASAPNYGADPASPWAEKSSAEVAGGKNDALGIPLHPFIPDTALGPQTENEIPGTPAHPRHVEPVEEPFAGLAAAQAQANSRTRDASDFPGDGRAESPWHEINRPEARAEANTQTRNDPFIGRTEPEPEPARRVDPFIGRTEPFVGRTEPRTAPRPEPRAVPEAPPPRRAEAPPSAAWGEDPDEEDDHADHAHHADAEPRFGRPASAVPPPSEPFPVIRETRPAARSGTAWKVIGSLIALVLLVGLAAQAAWWQRETVMVYWPASQPLIAQACEQVGCAVAPPRDIDGLQIENSGLRQVDGSHKLELKLSLRNRFDLAIAYPALELTLLDDKNNVAIRRVLWPQDYARPGTQIGTGLAARSTQPVIVRLDTGDAVAANYRVQIFYP
ncbi:hypothetical protein ASG35_26455 [Burkholderia sp. Leaf177]|uniref:zinc-ribbon and DUF3426 domain-containing protein n=1 Tax=Burkholderia sp. Leaf177 TaxID=1736287 RepID=UPI0006F5DF8E|nr:zinc-ribbon and DUF3426 domain-containing protein [Burkholderia sp. Leaf177]KQR85347.1 hypothetical protein ASG35_26455 [Burkholderia sp. Leaf177]